MRIKHGPAGLDRRLWKIVYEHIAKNQEGNDYQFFDRNIGAPWF